MSVWSWLLHLATRPGDDGPITHGRPGPVLDADGKPVPGPDGKPLQKVRVVIRRDQGGDPEEEAWTDPRTAWHWDETRWTDRPL